MNSESSSRAQGVCVFFTFGQRNFRHRLTNYYKAQTELDKSERPPSPRVTMPTALPATT